MKTLIISLFIILTLALVLFAYLWTRKSPSVKSTLTDSQTVEPANALSISFMRQRSYPGSPITIEQKLPNGSNYSQYITSYTSEGLKIYALLTVPMGKEPDGGWPAIVFNHGYIAPEIYKTTQRYVSYVDYLARNGYVVFKPDYRGHGNSQGNPEGAYYSPAYTIDDLNAIASIRNYTGVNPDKIGIWGHSMGGNITLRDLVINTSDIKAAVIWGGVVGSYDDLISNWHRKATFRPSARELALRNNNRQNIISKYGTPSTNPDFWNSIDPTSFVADITSPVQIHHGESDNEVPIEFSQSLFDKLQALGKASEFYSYKNADHNISGTSFNLAMERTVNFFNKYLKS